MKACAYCGGAVDDGACTCPHCSATKFQNLCPRCGAAYDGVACPVCSEADRIACETQAAAQGKVEAEARANRGLGWKTALTVFLPFIGGYFLIDENVKRGFRIFGIAWCAFFSIYVGQESSQDVGANILASLLCLAPIAVYLFKIRSKLRADTGLKDKVPFLVFAAVLVIALVADVASAT